MSKNPNARRLWTGKIVLPAVSLLGLLVAWQSGNRWIAFAALGLLAAGLVFVPLLVRRRLETFDKQAMKLLATGQAKQVEALARSQLLLSMLGPRGCMDGKLGLAMLETGRYNEATWRLRSGLAATGGAAALPLQTGLCKAYLLTNEPAQAEAMGAQLARSGFTLPEVQAVRAVSSFLLGKHDVARDYAQGARALSHSGEVAQMLDLLDVELDLAAGKSAELPLGDEPTSTFLSAWRQLVCGKIHQKRGNPTAAEDCYRRALEIDRIGFVAAAARRLLTAQDWVGHNEAQALARDPAVARKKKKK